MTPGALTPGAVQHALATLFPQPSPYRDDPVAWVHERLGEHLWSRQRDVARALVTHRKVAVPACHSAGKSFLAARLVSWWLDPDVHPPGSAFAVTTAPTDTQVKAILWREIAKARRAGDLPGRVTQDAQWKLRVGGDEELVAYGRKPQDLTNAEEAATAFQGIHARYVLVVVDEACGIPTWLWDAVDALLTNEDARVLAIGNPTDPTSKFAELCGFDSQWHLERISGWSTPNFTGEQVPDSLKPMLLSQTWVDEAVAERGRDSAYVVSRVDATFPKAGDDTAVISQDLIEAAQARDLSGTMVGDRGTLAVDVARLGEDEGVIGLRRGGVFRVRATIRKQRTTVTTQRVLDQRDAAQPFDVVVDADGIGGSVADQLIADGHHVHEFTMTSSPHDPSRFKDRRAECWWALRELMEDGGLDIDPADKELARQLGQIRFWERPVDGRIQVESKKHMRERGLGSPDRADTLIMALSVRSAPVTTRTGLSDEPATLTGDLLERAW